LFAFQASNGSWAPMTKTWFMKRCTQIWDAAGILLGFGHSFRIGGSTELLLRTQVFYGFYVITTLSSTVGFF
ncbi:hypothetical protein DFH08DRAFT_708228, partial [Mycena albidolilacea]